MELVLVLIVALSVFHTVGHIFCLIIGVNIGQKIVQGKEVSIPNPVTALKEYQEQKEHKKVEERDRVMLENIEKYDGTELGQQEVRW